MPVQQKQIVTAYRYECELEFHGSDGKTSLEIQKEGLKYLTITHNYDEFIMPVMYMKVKLFPHVYNAMVPDQGKGKIYLNLIKTKILGATSNVPKSIITEEFDYYMTDNPNTYKKLDEVSDTEYVTYKTCFIGLIKLDLQKKNHRIFEGIYKNTNSMSLIQAATADFKTVIQPFDNNRNFELFICPTITSIGKFIGYLNSQASFYNGGYMYYMDLDKTYLRSNDGSYIDAKDGDYSTIAFMIKEVLDSQSLTTGMIEDPNNKSYIVYLSGMDAQITVNRIINNLVGNVSSINTADGIVNNAAVDTEKTTNVEVPDAQTMYISIDDLAAKNLSTRISENTVTLRIVKLDMDSKVFTPNKQYLLSNYDSNPKYCGRYYLTKKEEIYLRTGPELVCQMTVTLKKCTKD